MISDHVVNWATKYLDKCFEAHEPATLVDMLNYIDYFERDIAVTEEVNEALRQRPSVYVQRESARIEFTSTGSNRMVTDDDMRRAFDIYEKEFWALNKKLEARKRSHT